MIQTRILKNKTPNNTIMEKQILNRNLCWYRNPLLIK